MGEGRWRKRGDMERNVEWEEGMFASLTLRDGPRGVCPFVL